MKNVSISFIFQHHRPIWNPGHTPSILHKYSLSLTFRFSNSLPHGISHLSPFLRSWFIQREGMVSIIYSIPTHLWPWLMHHKPSSSLCQACHRIRHITHTLHTPLHTRTHTHTGHRVQASTHIYSRSLSASPMDTWQQECTIITLDWSQTAAVLKWLHFLWSWVAVLHQEIQLRPALL